MSELSGRLARALGLSPRCNDLIRSASVMHDVGNIAVSDRVLHKPRSAHPSERADMQRHALAAYRILAGSRSELLQIGASIAWSHHERWDGSGYPRRLKGEQITLEARIAAVADAFDSLIRARFHRARFSRADALQIVLDGRGSEFDPDVVDALQAVPAPDADDCCPRAGWRGAGRRSAVGGRSRDVRPHAMQARGTATRRRRAVVNRDRRSSW